MEADVAAKPADPIKVMVVVGTRPEAIKMAPILRDLRSHPDFRPLLVTTAQHRELVDEVLELFGLKPDHDLEVMAERQSLEHVVVRVLTGMGPLLAQERPDLVLVEGDTSTVLAAALAAFHQQVRVGHVEAGLRTRDRYHPFPEEMNRRLVGCLADLHFAPTERARDNLLSEQVAPQCVFVTGNTVIDALQQAAALRLPLPAGVEEPRAGERLVVLTAHRRENWGEPLREICRAVRTLVGAHPDLRVVYALHPNPVVQEAAREVLEGVERVMLLNFPSYGQFVSLMSRAYLIMTDSGGIQEEAPALGKPVLVLRTNTERPEGVAAGVARLVGVSAPGIVAQVEALLQDEASYRRMAQAANPYGDGRASERIREAIRYCFGRRPDRPGEFRADVTTA